MSLNVTFKDKKGEKLEIEDVARLDEEITKELSSDYSVDEGKYLEMIKTRMNKLSQ